MVQWLAFGSFEAMVHDLRVKLWQTVGRRAQPSAIVFDDRTLQSTPDSGAGAGYDGHKKGSVEELASAVQEVTGDNVETAFPDQAYTRDEEAQAGQNHGITLRVVKLPETRRGFVPLPKRRIADLNQPTMPTGTFLPSW